MIKKYVAKISYDRRSHRYLVKVPDIPGCVTTGRTREEAFLTSQMPQRNVLKCELLLGLVFPKRPLQIASN